MIARRTSATSLILLVVSLTTALGAEAENEEGTLKVYGKMTSGGTTACREFQDEENRIRKRIHYGLGMKVVSTVAFEYDDQVRPKLTSYYYPNGELERTLSTIFDQSGNQRGTWRDGNGRRTYVMGRNGPKMKRHSFDLYFDNSGQKLIGARGWLPSDHDLTHGWGKVVSGLSCGLGVSSQVGSLDEIRLYITVRNQRLETPRSKTIFDKPKDLKDGQLRGSAKLPMGAQYYKPRLIDSEDRVFNAGEWKHAPKNRQRDAHRSSISPGKVESRDGPRALAEWFSDIPAGDYKLLVVHPDPDLDMSLVSNTINITIKEPDSNDGP